MTVRGFQGNAIAAPKSNAAGRRGASVALAIVSALFLSACAAPSYIDKNATAAT